MSGSRPSADAAPQTDPLGLIRSLATSPADRVRWACTLEAIAPKAGNVHPSAQFADLSIRDFLAAADAIARVIGAADPPGLGELVLRSTQATTAVCRGNVNLGIILLLAPLRLAAHQQTIDYDHYDRAPASARLSEGLRQVLNRLTPRDGGQVFEAIRLAAPGGLGRSDTLDVHDSPTQVDLLAAMHHARLRDRIALQYATGFDDLLSNVVPVIDAAIRREGDVLRGICWAQVELLSDRPDTLIQRKRGGEVAEQVRQRAADVLAQSDPAARQASWHALDRWLREDGHRRNPGTTADLIAAALWVLLQPLAPETGNRKPEI